MFLTCTLHVFVCQTGAAEGTGCAIRLKLQNIVIG